DDDEGEIKQPQVPEAYRRNRAAARSHRTSVDRSVLRASGREASLRSGDQASWAVYGSFGSIHDFSQTFDRDHGSMVLQHGGRSRQLSGYLTAHGHHWPPRTASSPHP